ncbi:hypothetical protein NMY22_g19330 [Coprinellus aureogranulatus]|nr:hypothetical protein NMY22_g19330 [Coprinellus aureogranulatus]
MDAALDLQATLLQATSKTLSASPSPLDVTPSDPQPQGKDSLYRNVPEEKMDVVLHHPVHPPPSSLQRI